MHEVDERLTTVHDRAPCDGSADALGKRGPQPVETGNDIARGVSRWDRRRRLFLNEPDRDSATALPRLADAGASGEPARAGSGPC